MRVGVFLIILHSQFLHCIDDIDYSIIVLKVKDRYSYPTRDLPLRPWRLGEKPCDCHIADGLRDHRKSGRASAPWYVPRSARLMDLLDVSGLLAKRVEDN